MYNNVYQLKKVAIHLSIDKHFRNWLVQLTKNALKHTLIVTSNTLVSRMTIFLQFSAKKFCFIEEKVNMG